MPDHLHLGIACATTATFLLLFGGLLFHPFLGPSQTKQASIKWLKSAILEQPNCAAQVPSLVGDDYEQRTAWEDDKDRTFHHRVNNSRAMRNLLDEEYEKATLRDDLGKRNGIKCVLPINHISACVAARFKGQSWMRYTEDDIRRDFV